jgi:uncharacterized membrane protein
MRDLNTTRARAAARRAAPIALVASAPVAHAATHRVPTGPHAGRSPSLTRRGSRSCASRPGSRSRSCSTSATSDSAWVIRRCSPTSCAPPARTAAAPASTAASAPSSEWTMPSPAPGDPPVPRDHVAQRRHHHHPEPRNSQEPYANRHRDRRDHGRNRPLPNSLEDKASSDQTPPGRQRSNSRSPLERPTGGNQDADSQGGRDRGRPGRSSASPGPHASATAWMRNRTATSATGRMWGLLPLGDDQSRSARPLLAVRARAAHHAGARRARSAHEDVLARGR